MGRGTQCVCYEQGNAITEKTVEYKANTMEWITRLYADNFTEVPLVINYHRQLGHPVSSGKNAQPDSEALLAIAIPQRILSGASTPSA